MSAPDATANPANTNSLIIESPPAPSRLNVWQTHGFYLGSTPNFAISSTTSGK
jgi:hypothetical protein